MDCQEQPAEDYGALLLWPAEGGEVEVPPSPATRGHCTDVITTTPWAQDFVQLRILELDKFLDELQFLRCLYYEVSFFND
ncbi:hypothetical protein Taro_042296 [Colocasia esculenta]|uniref:Uncharacterized protein n=1 Tax=Colocasia esculenta TaxID=4460 RepID=A0A843WDL4_COLES|nr:hypothetical protein [Colocasia esculenta]